VAREGNDVVFCEFTSKGARKEFRFSASNYDTVCNEIAARAQQQRDRDAAGRREPTAKI
jgi:hypothetical protein